MEVRKEKLGKEEEMEKEKVGGNERKDEMVEVGSEMSWPCCCYKKILISMRQMPSWFGVFKSVRVAV